MNSHISHTKKDAHDKVIQCLEKGMTMTEAGQCVGVNRRTILNWRHADEAFNQAVQDACDSADDMVEAVAFRNCINPDPAHNTLRIFWLKCRRPDVYREKADQSQSPVATIRVEYADKPIAQLEHHADAPPSTPGTEPDHRGSEAV